MSDLQRSRIEIAIERALRQDRISRRNFLGQPANGGVALGALMTLPGLIAACSPSGSGNGVTLEWANWPAYIDIDEENPPDPTNYPSINAFIAQTGIDVHYTEAILDNADFYHQIQPDLANGNSTGWDLITPGGWVVERMARPRLPGAARPRQAPELDGERADWADGQLVRPGQHA